MGKHRVFIAVQTIAVLMVIEVSAQGGSLLQPFLPKDTFIIHDARLVPINPPQIPPYIDPQSSVIHSNPLQQQAFIPPPMSFIPSNQQSNAFPQRTHQQTDFGPQRGFSAVSPPQIQSNNVYQRPSAPAIFPRQDDTPQRPVTNGNPYQQQANVAPQRPNLPPQMHSSAPSNSQRIVPNTRQTIRPSQSSGNPQQPSYVDQGNHRFSTPPQPNVQYYPSTSQQNILRTHQSDIDDRQTLTPQQNTIRRPSGRHHMCGVLPTSGDCRAAFPRYYYNNKTDQCDCFLYGGCGEQGIKYSYRTLEECRQTCLPSRSEEGPACKEIFHEEELFHSSHPSNPRPHPSPSPPQPHLPPNHILPTVDTSHIPNEPLIIYLINSAKGKNENTDYENNESRYK